jgi:hypothetical protein
MNSMGNLSLCSLSVIYFTKSRTWSKLKSNPGRLTHGQLIPLLNTPIILVADTILEYMNTLGIFIFFIIGGVGLSP